MPSPAPQPPTTPAASGAPSDAPSRQAPRPGTARDDGGVSRSVRGIARMAVFAALVAVLGQPFAVPVIAGVPITLQTLGVMLAGAVLGPWRGAGAMALLHLLVAAGMPLLSQGSGGLAVYAGPTAGYALGWIPGALVVGAIAQAGWPLRLWRTAAGAVLGGVAVIHACGIPVMAWQLGLSLPQAAVSSAAFLPGDLAKAVAAVLLTHALARAYPTPFEHARRRRS